MTLIPQNLTTVNDLVEWDRIQKEMASLKAKEMILRIKIYKAYFPDIPEGTSRVELAAGYMLKAERKVSRTLDEAVVTALAGSNVFEKEGIFLSKLIAQKPSLVMKEYRTLTEEQKAIFDQCLEIKDATPSLAIEPPKKEKDNV